MNLPIYQVDAFTAQLFGGNPAAVMPLQAWLADETLQAIAAENNLSETAFFVPAADGSYALRWFTPAMEVDLCGHATLATAHVLYRHLGAGGDSLRFQTRSGELRVSRDTAGLTLDFPAYELQPLAPDPGVCAAIGAEPVEAWQAGEGGKLLYVYTRESEVAALAPDFTALFKASTQPVIASAPGGHCDFVSRFFAPSAGIDEDPVTGSAHCALVPYWAGRLQKSLLGARQISARGGVLQCELRGDRVRLSGQAVTFMQGEVLLP